MQLEIKVYDNGDHICLVWCPAPAEPIENCLGFAVFRRKNGQDDYLPNTVGFDPDASGPEESWKWPIQRYFWWDYDVKVGDTVQYAVVPMIGPPASLAEPATAPVSLLTPPLQVTGQATKNLSAFFNRGIIATQWVAEALAKIPTKQANRGKLKDVISTVGNPLRDALSGTLREQILGLLRDVKTQGGSIYAALYELNDPELLGAIRDLGTSANIILANGAFSQKKPDENAEVRSQLKALDTVHVYDRLVSRGHFAHNKFVVFCDSQRRPVKVLTGSTNWTVTGLCTQANNGLIINDASVAQAYLDQWNRLHAAGNGYPPELAAADSQLKTFTVDGKPLTAWFAPTQHAEDLEQARQLINKAQDGILFLFFNPGAFEDDPQHWTLLQSILNRHQPDNNPVFDGQLYLRGVVNQEIPQLTEPGTPKPKVAHHRDLDPSTPTNPVSLYTGGNSLPQRLSQDVLVPKAIQQKYAHWVPELLGESMVMIHSKVIVIDPFGDHPVVMTGSHNLGFKASSKNDDNLVIIEGNAPLAQAYAVNIISIYQTYRWRNYLQQTGDPSKKWRGLQTDSSWQDGHLQGTSLSELRFWLGLAPLPAPPGNANPDSPDPHSPSANGKSSRNGAPVHPVKKKPSKGGVHQKAAPKHPKAQSNGVKKRPAVKKKKRVRA